jgi:hypothetical protein
MTLFTEHEEPSLAAEIWPSAEVGNRQFGVELELQESKFSPEGPNPNRAYSICCILYRNLNSLRKSI